MSKSFSVWPLLAIVLAAIPGCVELTGQRVTWFYDKGKDELQIYLFYDGIHDSGSNNNGTGVEQIPRFVGENDFMLLDWPFHINRAALQGQSQAKGIDPVQRDWYKLLLSVGSEPIGRYREPDGRVGAVQRLTIPKTKDFIHRANELISRSVLAWKLDPHEPVPRTVQRFQAAAKAGHAWIVLDGQAIRVTLPVEAEEWSRVKAEFLKDVATNVATMFGEKASPDQKRAILSAIRCLAAAPVSYIDEGDRAEFVVGRREAPPVFRVEIRGGYESSLETIVETAVRTDFDKEVAESLLGRGKADPAVAAAMKAAFPEVSVGALLQWAKSGDKAAKSAAIHRLETWADTWNRDHTFPPAPKPDPSQDKYFAAWQRWYEAMKQYPLDTTQPGN